MISQKRLGCNGLGLSDLQGKTLAKLVAPLASDTQGRGWELGRSRKGLCPCSPNHICLLPLFSSFNLLSFALSVAIPPSNSLCIVLLTSLSFHFLICKMGKIEPALRGCCKEERTTHVKGLAHTRAWWPVATVMMCLCLLLDGL